MAFDNGMLELMVRSREARKVMLGMGREEEIKITQLRILDPFGCARYTGAEAGSGYLFNDLFADRARYVSDRGCWYVYRDGIWVKDHGERDVMEMSRQLARMMHVLSFAQADETAQQDALRRAQRMYTQSARLKMLREAQSISSLLAADFDKDPWLFNCLNGVLDLRTGAFREHRASDLMTRMAGVRYDPDARCERWEQFIREIMAVPGQQQLCLTDDAPDPSQLKAEYLQRAIGYAMSGSTQEECFFILHGATTRNGKGTLMETLVRVFGDYARVARPETIAQRVSSGAAPNEDMARLQSARLVSVSELDSVLTLSAGLVKQVTGNDTITARFLHENSFQFRPQFKLFINTNHLPRVDDLTLFHSGRVRIIPFERHFTPDEQDQGLKEFFAQPERLSAVLNWCLHGLRAWQQDGLMEPLPVKRATESYRRESDQVEQFWAECLQRREGERVKTSDVYRRYRAWCDQQGEKTCSSQQFWKQMAARVTVKRMRITSGGNPVNVLQDHILV